MRENYHDELDEIDERIIEMSTLAAAAMDAATRALLTCDLELAEWVIGGDDRIDALRAELESASFQLIARQQPVATDLRMLIGAVHLAGDLERMGDLAHHVAKLARMRFPDCAVPPEAHDIIERMGAVARSLVQKVVDVVDGIADRDIALAQAIEAEDDAMDALRRALFALVLSPDWAQGTEAAVDLTLLGRYYERYADHAVAVARQARFIVNGQHVHS